MDCSLPGSSVHVISQARILEWVAILFSIDLLDLGIEPGFLALQVESFPTEPPRKPQSQHILFQFANIYFSEVSQTEDSVPGESDFYPMEEGCHYSNFSVYTYYEPR